MFIKQSSNRSSVGAVSRMRLYMRWLGWAAALIASSWASNAGAASDHTRLRRLLVPPPLCRCRSDCNNTDRCELLPSSAQKVGPIPHAARTARTCPRPAAIAGPWVNPAAAHPNLRAPHSFVVPRCFCCSCCRSLTAPPAHSARGHGGTAPPTPPHARRWPGGVASPRSLSSVPTSTAPPPESLRSC